MTTELNDLMDAPVINKLQKEIEKQKEYETYLKSPEWKEILKKAETAVNRNYTIIYRDTDQELKEAWHYLSDDNIDYVKETYKKLKRPIYHFVLKELPYGEYLKSIKGSSKL